MIDRSSPSGSQPGSSPGASLQLRFFQALSVILLALLLGGIGYYVYRQRTVQPVAILIGGKPVATVTNAAAANALLKKEILAALGPDYAAAGQPQYAQTILLQRVPDSQTIDTDDSALAKISAAARITTLADVILIDNHPFVALPNKEAAQAALDDVREYYAQMPPDTPPVEKPSFQEHVTIDRRRAPAALCKDSATDAAQLLETPPPAKTTVVQMHQTGWSIAREHKMSFTDFIRANSGRDLNHLAPGDTVNISRTFPPLTVIVQKESSSTQAIVPGASAQNAGERRMTMITTYINGVSTGSSMPVSVVTVRRATPWRSLE